MNLRLGAMAIVLMTACVLPRSSPKPEGSGKDSEDTAETDGGDTAGTNDTDEGEDSGDTGTSDEEAGPTILCLDSWSTASGQAGVYATVAGDESWDFGSTDYAVSGGDVPGGGDDLCTVLPEEFDGEILMFNGWNDPYSADPDAYAADPENFSDWMSYVVYSCTSQGSALVYDYESGRCSDVALKVNGHPVDQFHPDPSIYNLYFDPSVSGG